MRAKVLIVTPDAERAGRYASALGDAGFWTTVAARPEQALERARQCQPDFVITDVLTAQCALELPRQLHEVAPDAWVAGLASEVFALDDGLRERLSLDRLLPRGTAPVVLQRSVLQLLESGARPHEPERERWREPERPRERSEHRRSLEYAAPPR